MQRYTQEEQKIILSTTGEKLKKKWKTFQTIILSRIKKPTEEQIVLDRRAICKLCPYNTKNQNKLSLKVRIIKSLSDFYSLVRGKKEEDNLFNCGVCGCSIYYKTLYEEECPHPDGDKWKNLNKNGDN